MNNYEYLTQFMDNHSEPAMKQALKMAQDACVVGTLEPLSCWLRGYAAGVEAQCRFWIEDPVLRQSIENQIRFADDYYWRHRQTIHG